MKFSRKKYSYMSKFNLRQHAQPQTYGLGIKEVWRIPKDKHSAGLVQHTLGWPLQHSLMDKTFGGSFLYHMNEASGNAVVSYEKIEFQPIRIPSKPAITT